MKFKYWTWAKPWNAPNIAIRKRLIRRSSFFWRRMKSPRAISDTEIPSSSHSMLTSISPRRTPKIIPDIKVSGAIQKFLSAKTLQKPTNKITKKWSKPLNGCKKPCVNPGSPSWPGWAISKLAKLMKKEKSSIFKGFIFAPPKFWLSSHSKSNELTSIFCLSNRFLQIVG